MPIAEGYSTVIVVKLLPGSEVIFGNGRFASSRPWISLRAFLFLAAPKLVARAVVSQAALRAFLFLAAPKLAGGTMFTSMSSENRLRRV